MHPTRLVIMGDSLGGGVAAGLAGVLHPWLPWLHWLAPQFPTAGRVARLDMPRLILHARDDEVAPLALAERLCEAAKAPKECHWFEHGGHNALYVTQRADYSAVLAGFLPTVAAASAR